MAEAAPQSAVTSEFKPHLFGKFFLLQRLAVGGMAEIYRARVPGARIPGEAGGFEKELVVKRILRARSQDQNFIKMLVREAILTVQLTHSAIAQVYECGTVDGNYFISMELVNGVSMKEMMHAFVRAGAQLTPEQSIFLVLQLLQGLAYAHRKTDPAGNPLKIVHCDVSPDNCLLSWEGEVKLLDFGIARAATGLSNYKEGMLMGKLGYVAPEQASLEKSWDHRVDVFAAGIILYELLTKQKPFPKATDVESLIQSRKAKVVPPTALDPRLPNDVDDIIARALAYDPERRYPDARSFADALVDVLFPTPHSSIQDHLARQMQQVFADKVARARQARAHDPLIMKVLYNAAQQEGTSELQPIGTPVPGGFSTVDTRVTPRATAAPRRRASRPRAVITDGVSLWKASLVGLAVAAVAAAGFHYGIPWIRPGAVIVTSDPPGLAIALDGAKTSLATPAVVEDVVLSRPHQVTLSGAGVKETTIPVPLSPGKLVARVHARLESTIGAITVESDPPGASVLLDDRPAGTTPATIRDVRLDKRHRIDLVLAGYEIDQFVVLPEKDGRRFVRRLSRGEGKGRRPATP
ncbi:MAG TPA: serine/threonine-protein kinase [Anaeromyxobacter sp.]|nr:serine/threonine-protein kinase [Anaeromyxobacter sp.]